MKKLSLIGLFFLSAMFSAHAKDLQVKGKVADEETGQKLKNCHVFINEHFGTITDEKGAFTLTIPENFQDKSLKISYLGYKTYEIPVKEIGSKYLNVNLVFDAIMLDDVVVVTPDPWEDFRTIIGEISTEYDNKREFMAAVFTEIDKIEFPKKEKSASNSVTNVESNGYKGEEFTGNGLLPGIIAFVIASLGLVFMAKPFIRLIDKSSK